MPRKPTTVSPKTAAAALAKPSRASKQAAKRQAEHQQIRAVQMTIDSLFLAAAATEAVAAYLVTRDVAVRSLRLWEIQLTQLLEELSRLTSVSEAEIYAQGAMNGAMFVSSRALHEDSPEKLEAYKAVAAEMSHPDYDDRSMMAIRMGIDADDTNPPKDTPDVKEPSTENPD